MHVDQCVISTSRDKNFLCVNVNSLRFSYFLFELNKARRWLVRKRECWVCIRSVKAIEIVKVLNICYDEKSADISKVRLRSTAAKRPSILMNDVTAT